MISGGATKGVVGSLKDEPQKDTKASSAKDIGTDEDGGSSFNDPTTPFVAPPEIITNRPRLQCQPESEGVV